MDTDSLRRDVWNGSIPCKINLDVSEDPAYETVSPYFVSIPRISYIPLVVDQIYRFFEPNFADPNECRPQNAWFEFEGVPLKWHWPVGVLFDLFTGRDPSISWDSDNAEYQLPWALTLHFQNWPAKHLMRLDTEDAVEDAWKNTLKQSACVRNGSAKSVLSMSKAESTKLWEGLSDHDFDRFWSVNEKLMADATVMRGIPIRVYIPSIPRVVQLPVAPFLESKEPQTVGTALNGLIPELFKSKRSALVARPVIHGVVVAMNTPVAELLQVAVYPDGFLHITLAMMS